MTFTQSERSKIRQYLGYPDRFLSVFSDVEDAMDLVGANSDAATIVKTIIEDLDAVSEQIKTAREVAGISSADNDAIVYFKKGPINDLRDHARNLVNRLSIKLDVPIRSDYFGHCGGNSKAFTGLSTGFF